MFLLLAGFASAQSGGIYPLKVGPTGRYLVDQNNAPFLIVGDSPQGMIADLTLSQASDYLANRALYGFNIAQIHLLAGNSFGGRTDYSTVDGITPFTTPGNIATPRESYFARVDSVINLAAQNGIVVFLTAAETIDSLSLFRANGVAKSRAFGQYLGNRYKNFPNIVWVYGNDFQTWTNSADNAVILAVANGIKDTDPNHLHTAWLNFTESASRDSPDWDAIINLDFVYTYYPTYAKTLVEYQRSPAKPIFMGESYYEGAPAPPPLGTPHILRRQLYWAMTSGSAGSVYGNPWLWPFQSGWQNHLNTPGAEQMTYFKTFFQARRWWTFAPDAAHQVLIGGYGTYDSTGDVGTVNYATAIVAADASSMIAYLPSVRTVAVNMSRLSGPVAARWFDPSNGTYQSIAGSPFANTGTRQFTPSGNNGEGTGDWLLVLESSSIDVTPPTISNVAATNLTATGATITWQTNEPSDSRVSYGVTSSQGTTTPADTGLVTSHSVTLAGLTAGTTYHFSVLSQDAAGNMSASADATFTTAAGGGNTPPTISALSAQTINQDTSTAPQSFVIGDAQTSAANLTLSSTTSNATLTPAGSVVFGGTGANRTVTVTPAAGQTGVATITVIVSDGSLTASRSFTLTVNPVSAGSGNGLVAAYNFDQGAGTVLADVTGNGNSGTITGATWTSAGRYGGALSFNGSNSMVVINSSPSLNLGAAMTLEAWVNPSATQSGWRTIVQREVDAYMLHASSNTAMHPAGGGTFNGTVAFVTAPSTLAVSTWTHLAVTYDGSAIRFFVNGVNVASQARTGAIQATSTPLRIGGNVPYGEFFLGLIDDVRVYNRALSAAEIQADMATPVAATNAPPPNAAPTISTIPNQVTTTGVAVGPIPFTVSDADTPAANLAVTGSSSNQTLVPNSGITFGGSGGDRTVTITPAAGQAGTATITLTVSDGSLTATRAFSVTVNATSSSGGLVAAYNFDEGSGTTLRDSSGNGNNGVIQGASWTTTGKFGGALTFNGSSSMVVVNSSPSLTLTNAMTLEAWVYPTGSQSGWRTIVQREVDAYFLHASSNSALRPAGGGTFNGTTAFVSSGTAIAVNTWTHLAVTYDQATIRLYVNGIQVASAPRTGTIQNTSTPLRIGGNVPYGEFFLGRIDNVRIYSRTLSPSEIQADMNTPVP